MKKISLVLVCLLLQFSTIFSQQISENKSKELNQRIAEFYQQGNFDQAIPLAEELVDLEKKATPEKSQTLATAYFNVGLLRKKRFQYNQRNLSDPKIQANRKKEIRKDLEEDGEKSRKAFERVIEIHKKGTLKDPIQFSDAQNELAWLLYNYADPLASKKTIYNQLNDAEQFYKNSIELREKHLGIDADETLSGVFNLAEFYMRQVKFEMALPNYQRFISTIEKKYGKNQKILLPALNSVADIFASTDDEEKAKEIVKEISDISGAEKSFPEANYILTKRLLEPESSEFLSPDGIFAIQSKISGSFSRNAGPLNIEIVNKSIPVKVLIDENGSIIEAIADTDETKYKKESEETIKKWKFKPFEYEGKRKKLRGYIIYKVVTFK